MCPDSCHSNGGCYQGPDGPFCLCKPAFYGNSCESAIEMTSPSVSAADVNSDFWAIILVFVATVFVVCGCVTAAYCYFRSKRSDVVAADEEFAHKARSVAQRVRQFVGRLV
ncbi:hypothetical protein CRE_29175 [Caenorhabditis remanei]|uniref:EGF-like domain-containing protein n=1 Tax=Caenorhabditis remanei TaxID=31234 RepID=E3ND47_CAERE|nr:hypothetical protein CRE_29175 [Caenorhabditis remanei]